MSFGAAKSWSSCACAFVVNFPFGRTGRGSFFVDSLPFFFDTEQLGYSF
jgi:hypothetical protein